jgi:hypothetical protein
VLADLVDADDVGMREPGQRLGLAREPSAAAMRITSALKNSFSART